MSCCFALCRVMCCIQLCCAVSCPVALCCVVSCYVLVWSVMLCYVTLCYDMVCTYMYSKCIYNIHTYRYNIRTDGFRCECICALVRLSVYPHWPKQHTHNATFTPWCSGQPVWVPHLSGTRPRLGGETVGDGLFFQVIWDFLGNLSVLTRGQSCVFWYIDIVNLTWYGFVHKGGRP